MVRIARELGVTKAAVTSITDEIETRGLVSRDRDTKDRRILNLEITPAGRRLLARAEETHFEIVTRLISDLTPEEKRVLIRSYEKLNKSLDALV